MNTNAWIFFTALLGLLLCLLLGRSALRSHSIVQQKLFAFIALLLLLCSLSGGTSLAWRMTHFSPSVSGQTPLSTQSQVIIQTSLTRSSLNGKDATLNWNYPYRSSCTMNPIFTVANGIIYERGALPQKQEVCIQATRLSNGTQLWSTRIKTSQSAENLRGNTLPTDQLLVANDRLYFQIDATFYSLNVSDGKILYTIKPTISGDTSALLDDFAVNNQALVLLYWTGGHSPGASSSFSLIALSPTTQKVQWKNTQGTYPDLIALQGETLYARSQGIVALNVHSGSKLWQADLPSSGVLAASATAERVYVRVQDTPGSADASICVYNTHNGLVLWKVPVASWAGATLAGQDALAPVEANGVVYVVDTNTLSAYQAATGQLLWRYKEDPLASDSIHVDPYKVIYFSQPVIVGNVVFAATTLTTSYPPPLELFPSFCLGRCTAPRTGIVALSASNGKSYWHHEVAMNTAILATTIA